ncbi:hypothetical protein MRX96_051875 [Rhipicephalus microplus]
MQALGALSRCGLAEFPRKSEHYAYTHFNMEYTVRRARHCSSRVGVPGRDATFETALVADQVNRRGMGAKQARCKGATAVPGPLNRSDPRDEGTIGPFSRRWCRAEAAGSFRPDPEAKLIHVHYEAVLQAPTDRFLSGGPWRRWQHLRFDTPAFLNAAGENKSRATTKGGESGETGRGVELPHPSQSWQLGTPFTRRRLRRPNESSRER